MWDKWESIADRKIREAMEAGAFDNLPDRGKLWMAHHLLRVNGFAPAWIEEARDIDESAARLGLLLRDRSPRAAEEFPIAPRS